MNKQLLAMSIVLLLVSNHSTQANDVYQVGVSRVDITPDYAIRLNGFGNRRQESVGVSQHIYAKSLAISETGDAAAPPLVLVTLDSLGIRQTMVDEVARRLMTSHQLPAANLVVTFTHSHCTPKVNGASDNIFSEPVPAAHQQHIDRYTKELTDRITQVAQQALDAMKPAHLAWAIGTVTFAQNRRSANGPVDHDLPMLVVRDTNTSQPRAVYVSYGCHCVTLSFNQISGDWAGYAAQMIERQFPGAVALVSIGAGSDQNPASGVTGDKVEVAASQGLQIAAEVQRLLAGELKPISGPPRAVRRQIALPLETPPTREQLVAQSKSGGAHGYNALTQLQRLDGGQPLIKEVDYRIQTWTFGDSLCMTFLAGEVCVDYAHRLKLELNRERFWLNAYSNDFGCYIPSERLLAEGGYGGGAEMPYFALPSIFQSGLEQKIVDEVQSQVPESFHVPAGTQGVPAKSPQDSLRCMQTAPNLRIVLAAAEPDVKDPVAIDFGPDGRLWVAEMNDYGHDVYASFPPTSRVRWLRDTDADGYFETAGTFLEGLRFPTDVKVWRDGLLICDAPDILWARDRDADGKADQVDTLFTGFEVRNAQARVNSLRFGLDNWIYGAGGLFGGEITSTRTGETVDCRNRDFRLNPDTGVIQAVSGRTQQGRCRNDWGDWFGCSNGALLTPIAADDDYQRRNPDAVLAPFHVFSTNAEALRLYPPDDLVTFELSGAPGRATAACGIGIYRDVALGDDFQNDAFTCEPVHQAVHRIDFQASHDTFIGRRGVGEKSREFLSSTDRWFRPVQVRTGPDGALWIVDMYRYVIEHSRWIPQSSLNDLDIYAGQGRGRIYRILPRQSQEPPTPQPVIPNLTALTDAQLATAIDSSNGTTRDLAHQLLLWRQAKNVAPDLRHVAIDSQLSAARIQALAALDGLGKLTPDDINRALQSQRAEVQRFAVKLSEPWLNETPALRAAVVQLTATESLRLRRQVALSLGASTQADAARAIARLLSSQQDHRVRSAAFHSASTGNLRQVVQGFRLLPTQQQSLRTWHQLLETTARAADATTVRDVVITHLPDMHTLTQVKDAVPWTLVLNALDARATSNGFVETIGGAPKTEHVFRAALTTLQDSTREEPEYRAAFSLLGRAFGPYSQRILSHMDDRKQFSASRRAAALVDFVSPRFSLSLQQAAVAAVTSTTAADAPELLLGTYASLSGLVRVEVLDALLSQRGGPTALLSAIDRQIVRADHLNVSQRNKLVGNGAATVRDTAARLLGATNKSSRSAIVTAHLPATRLAGSIDQGRLVFRKRCASCHRLEDHGHVVGPDLAALTNRDPQWLLTTILDPNKEVDARYLAWTAITHSGRTMTGMIVEETATTIRLREAGGKEHLIKRNELDRFQSSRKSVMPEGLERELSQQDLSDVIAYLTSFVSPPKTFSGNMPQLVAPEGSGVFRLTAATAEIRGTHIRFESPYDNIGYWHHQTDTVTWRVDVAQSGRFDVYLNASCDDQAAGNSFRIEGMAEVITGKVDSTGGWQHYRQYRTGTAQLTAGRHVITVRAAAPIQRALFDLRELQLVPVGQKPNFPRTSSRQTALPRRAHQIAPFLLDDAQPTDRRQQVIDQRPGLGPAIISQLVSDLDAGDTIDEYRRIPWIWRVAIAVARRDDGGEIRDVLEMAVPSASEPLRDWQAVVLGGGLINGATQIGVWPNKRLNEILVGLPAVKATWPETLQKSVRMSENPRIRTGTRYDALRMVALLDPSQAIPHLQKYLGPKTPTELQMGAVSGLVDVESPDSTQLLIGALSYLAGRNRQLALEGLLRTELRSDALAKHIKSGQLTLTENEFLTLRNHPLATVRKHFEALDIRK